MSSCIHFISQNIKSIGDFSKQSVHNLNLGTSPVICVKKYEKAITAFKYIAQKNISGIGVVGTKNELIGNVSARDLKIIGDEMSIYHILSDTCGNFISHIKNKSFEENAPVIAVRPETSLEFVIGRMSINRIHRLYVTDKDGSAISIISLRDVLKCLMNHIIEK